MIKLSILAAFSLLSVVLGLGSFSSEQCSGTVKWNGNIDTPKYLWKLDAENHVIFCPVVTCDNGADTCAAIVQHPSPDGPYTHYCACNYNAGTSCFTQVTSNSEWGPITSVTCGSSNCNSPKTCSLRAQGGPDPNGYYDVKCTCE